MGVFTGIIHVHSTFSYDGVHSLDELAEFGRRNGYGFMAMSEHSETLDPEKMTLYVRECQRVTGDDFVMIPGIEFACEGNLHVLGFGLREYTDLRNPGRVAEFVRERGGVPVVAHPGRYNYRIPFELAPILGGIEVWNAGYDGRFVPDECSLNLLKEFRKQNASIMAFAGQDLHGLRGRCKVNVVVRADRLDGTAIVRALAKGEFAVGNGVFRLDALRGPGPLKLIQIAAARRVYEGAKRARNSFEAWRGARAVRAPRGLPGRTLGWRAMRARDVRELPRPFFQAAEGPDTAERRLLLISYHFPPGQATGALRWQKLTRYAAERGWALDVVTLHPSSMGEPDMRRLAELPAGTRVYGVPDPMLAVERAERAIWRMYRRIRPIGICSLLTAPRVGTARAESVGRAEIRWSIWNLPLDLRRAYFAWLEYARCGRWARRAAALALRLSESKACRAVVTCGPPHMAHEAGSLVSLRTGLPFVMDLRDPWSLMQRLPEAIASPVWLKLATRYECRAVARAALVVTNTEPLRLAMRAAYPAADDRIITVMNGCDDEIVPRSRHGRRFTIAYAGAIYLDRDPRIFFTAAGRVVRMLKLAPQDFRIELMGDVQSYNSVPIPVIAHEAGLDGFVCTIAAGSRREAMEFLAQATLLVSLPLVSLPQDSDLTIPAKIFDYMHFDAWILALADRGSATELLLRDSGADVVSPWDLDAITEVILTRYRQYAEGRRPTRLAARGRYSRRDQARLLFDAIEGCLDGAIQRESESPLEDPVPATRGPARLGR